MLLCYWVYFVHLNWVSSTWLLLGLIYELKLSPNGCALETHDVHQSTLIGHIEEVHQLSSNACLHYRWSLFWLCKQQVGFLRLFYFFFKFILMLHKELYFFFLSFFRPCCRVTPCWASAYCSFHIQHWRWLNVLILHLDDCNIIYLILVT